MASATSLNFTFTPWTLTAPTQELETRKNALIQKVRTFENRIRAVTQLQSQIKIGHFNATPEAFPSENCIHLPSWFLLKYEDIPERFRIVNIDDPRLNNNQFLDEMAAWMKGKIIEFGLTYHFATIDKSTLKFVIRLLRDREKFEQAKDFTLAHERSHLSHELKSKVLMSQIMRWVPTVLTILGVVISIALFPFVSFAIIVAINVGIFITNAITRYFWNTHQISFWKEEEKKADLEAVNLLQGNPQGGIYFFETMRLNNLQLKKEAAPFIGAESNAGETSQGRPLTTLTLTLPNFNLRDLAGTAKECMQWLEHLTVYFGVDNQGNNSGDHLHPPLTERIAYLDALRPQSQRV